jgi:hypothetical protein
MRAEPEEQIRMSCDGARHRVGHDIDSPESVGFDVPSSGDVGFGLPWPRTMWEPAA